MALGFSSLSSLPYASDNRMSVARVYSHMTWSTVVKKPSERSGREEVNVQRHSEKRVDVKWHVKARGRPISKMPSIFEHTTHNSSTIESNYHASAEKFSCMISLLDQGEGWLHMFAQSVTAASVSARNASSTPPY